MASRTSSPGELATPPVPVEDDRCEGEVLEEEEPREQEQSRENSATAVGKTPGQPGESTDNLSVKCFE